MIIVSPKNSRSLNDSSACTRRRFLLTSGALTAGLSLSGLKSSRTFAADSKDKQAEGLPTASNSVAAEDILDAGLCDELRLLLTNVCDWVMGLDLGSGVLKNVGVETNNSTFINGNFARVLIGGHKVLGHPRYGDEALRWCDSFVDLQRPTITSTDEKAGYWGDIPGRNIYLADAGTAATALALGYMQAQRRRQERYLAAMENFSRFVRFGCREDPQGRGRGGTSGWLTAKGKDRGALGCGYYRGHLSTAPYIISTAVNAAAFHSLLYSINQDPELTHIVAGAVRWILAQRQPNGELPYIIDNRPPSFQWPLNTMTYCTEGLIAAYLHLDDPALRREIASGVEPCVEWLLSAQRKNGSWGEMASHDQQRSPGVTTLLAWYYRNVNADPRIAKAIRQYCRFLLNPVNQKVYGMNRLVRTTSFIGLVLADLLSPEVTFAKG